MIPMERDKHLKEDLGWEDKEEKIGDEIEVEKENDAGNFEFVQGKDYSKSFLLDLNLGLTLFNGYDVKNIMLFIFCLIHHVQCGYDNLW